MRNDNQKKVTVISVNVKLNSRIAHNECIYNCFVKDVKLVSPFWRRRMETWKEGISDRG